MQAYLGPLMRGHSHYFQPGLQARLHLFSTCIICTGAKHVMKPAIRTQASDDDNRHDDPESEHSPAQRVVLHTSQQHGYKSLQKIEILPKIEITAYVRMQVHT
jgi:hypothetical protein